MIELKPFIKSNRQECLTGMIAAALFPTTIIAYFCNRNLNEFTSKGFIFQCIALMFVAGVLAYLVSLVVFRRAIGALVFCMVCWIGFFLPKELAFEIIWNMNLPNGYNLVVFTGIIVAIAGACGIAVNVIMRNVFMLRYLILIFTIAVLVFLYNFVPIIVSNGVANVVLAEDNEGDEAKYDFAISNETPSPNIYWIHADGMLGVDTFEKYYGDAQESFLEDLSERGFEVNREASFEAGHHTRTAIPALICPYAYDEWLGRALSTHEGAMEVVEDSVIQQKLRDLRKEGELQTAFSAKGYQTIVVGVYDYYYPMYGGLFYNVMEEMLSKTSEEKFWIYTEETGSHIDAEANKTENIGSISYYLGIIFSLIGDNFGEEDQYSVNVDISDKQLKEIIINGENTKVVEMVKGVYKVLYGCSEEQPYLLMIHDLGPHGPWQDHADGSSTYKHSIAPLDYYEEHQYNSRVLIGLIDMILEKDMDAVIVVQSDHGLHFCTKEDFEEAFGEGADEIELWNSTMSAIRIPEKYKNGDEDYAYTDPLNISRYLVNNYVGENYEYR